MKDPSNLRYDDALGFKGTQDGGEPGPGLPEGWPGWVRRDNNTNCNHWTSTSPNGFAANFKENGVASHAWSRDGKWLAMSRGTSTRELVRIPISGNNLSLPDAGHGVVPR